MSKQILFFHGGGGEDDYAADAKLVESLKANLGHEYSVAYPLLPDNGKPDLGRREQIPREITGKSDGVILVAHSLGASMLLACLCEFEVRKRISGIFLLATPFWSGNEDWVKPFQLQPDFAKRLDAKVPLYFYHCRDDEEVTFDHMRIYKQHVPWASFRELPVGGHQFNNDLSVVAGDIKSL